MIDETRITLDEQLEKQPEWPLGKCSKCLFKQKTIVMSYENLFMDMICHTRILVLLVHIASSVKLKRPVFPDDTLLPLVRKL